MSHGSCRVLVGLAALVMLVCCVSERRKNDPRYEQIRHAIKKNLRFSAHLVWAVDARTIEAVRKEITEADIPVLARMLGDEENVLGIGAQHLLEALGERALPALQEAAGSTDHRVSGKAREAIGTIEPARRPATR